MFSGFATGMKHWAGIGGEELTQDELDTLSATRSGTYPWQRDERS